MQVEIAPLHAARRADFDQASGTTRIVTRLAVAEAAFVEVQQGDGQGGRSQESITWKWSRSASTNSNSSPVMAR